MSEEIKDGDIVIVPSAYGGGEELLKIVGAPTAAMMTASTWRDFGNMGWSTPARRKKPNTVRKVPEGVDPQRVSAAIRESHVRFRHAREQAYEQHNARLDKIAPRIKL